MITVSAFVLTGIQMERSAEDVPLTASASASRIIYQFDKEGSGDIRQLLQSQRKLATTPTGATDAVEVATNALQLFQHSGNTRYLSAARSAIMPWWDEPDPDSNILLLRARIKQTEHRFSEAAIDLSRLNQRPGRNISAFLLEADAWRRAGDIKNSQKACVALALAGRMILSRVCSAELLLSLGQYERAKSLLQKVSIKLSRNPPAEQVWVLAIYADSLVALGQSEAALGVWQKIMQQQDVPLSYKLSYADILLSLSRGQEVIELFEADQQSLAILLRVAAASRQTDSARAESLSKKLALRLQLVSQGANSDLHLREQALFSLWIEDDCEVALDYALANWELQKGLEDIELVLQLARMCQHEAAIQRIEQWRRQVSAEATT